MPQIPSFIEDSTFGQARRREAASSAKKRLFPLQYVGQSSSTMFDLLVLVLSGDCLTNTEMGT
jgi:hypothetical protein